MSANTTSQRLRYALAREGCSQMRFLTILNEHPMRPRSYPTTSTRTRQRHAPDPRHALPGAP